MTAGLWEQLLKMNIKWPDFVKSSLPLFDYCATVGDSCGVGLKFFLAMISLTTMLLASSKGDLLMSLSCIQYLPNLQVVQIISNVS